MKRNAKAGKSPSAKAKPSAADPESELREPSSPVCYLREFDDLSTVASGIHVKRAYEPASPGDGTRILIDRLWPRGIKRSALKLDAWLKDVAPSTTLRRWFHQDQQKRWKEFQMLYRAQLESQSYILEPLYAALRRGPLTLVYGARDASHNHAIILSEFLLKHRPASEPNERFKPRITPTTTIVTISRSKMR